VAEEFDVIVIGGGAMGTAAARTLAERGRSTLLLERFTIGHGRGSSGGPTRIFRLAHPDPRDVRMARLAGDLWRELEDRSGEALLHTTGSLLAGERDGTTAAALEAAGVAFERLTPLDVTERWPALAFERGVELLSQDDGGVCMAERTVRTQARLAVGAGASVREETPVRRLSVNGFGVDVDTDGGAYHAMIAVVTAGAWSRGLLGGTDWDLPLVPTLEQVTYFALERPSSLPVLLDRTLDPALLYTVPNPEEPGSFKVGLHMSGPPVDPDQRGFDPDPEHVAHVTAYADGRFAPHTPTGASDTCLYTNTLDQDFVLDRRGPLVVGSACSGHGFKFTPLIGRILADLATAQPAPMPIERFLAERPSLWS
jgi:sarcosine oxidase